jgi:hypothetical protein
MGSGITNSILLMLVIMLSINVGLSFTQSAVGSLNLTKTPSILNESSSPLNNYYKGSDLTSGVSLINASWIPSDEATADTGTGNIFTDTYVALKTYVSTGLKSIGFLVNLLKQPGGFLKDVGVPSAICLAIQIIWSIMFIFLITAWIMGRT